MSRILGVKFRDFGQIYYFDSGPYVVSVDDHVIVETEQGRGLAQVAVVREDVPESVSEEEVKTIFRLANKDDLRAVEENKELGREAFAFCKECIRKRELDMKLVDVEVFFDRSKMVFYFTAPGRVDFRDLVKDLVREYRTRIELRQIGVRHETQMLGAVGNCGQLCCCRRFMRKFDPVTIKMAKEQNLFLNPAKISGICGRLLCCLNFEQQNYEGFQKRCPKIGKRFQTSLGPVKVLRSNFFRESLAILLDSGEEREITLDEWTEIHTGGTPAPPPQAPRKREVPAGRPAPGRKESPARKERAAREEPAARPGKPADKPEAKPADAAAPEGEKKDDKASRDKSGRRRGKKPRRKSDLTAKQKAEPAEGARAEGEKLDASAPAPKPKKGKGKKGKGKPRRFRKKKSGGGKPSSQEK